MKKIIVMLCLTLSVSAFSQEVENSSKKVKEVLTDVSEKVVDTTKETKDTVVKKVIEAKEVVVNKVSPKPQPTYTFENDEWKISAFPNIMVNVGFVMASDEGSEKAMKNGWALGVYSSFITKKINSDKVSHLNLMSVGMNMQDSGRVNAVLSPVSITFHNKLNMGIGFMPQNNKTQGGTAILHLGWDF